MEFTPARFAYTTNYLREVFGKQDDHLQHLMDDATKAGLPSIAVSSDVGHLLQLMVSMTEGKRVVELGTLGGYSTIWLARGLKAGGKVVTVEIDERHAKFAQQQFDKADVADRVELRRGAALEVLPKLHAELGDGSVDAFFFDAVKNEYPKYWALAKPMLKRGGLLLADNVLGAAWWIDQEGDPVRDVVDQFNRSVANDPDMDVACVPLREGVLVARRR